VISKAQIAWSRLEVEVEAEAGGCGAAAKRRKNAAHGASPGTGTKKVAAPKGRKNPSDSALHQAPERAMVYLQQKRHRLDAELKRLLSQFVFRSFGA